jgi:putative transposase
MPKKYVVKVFASNCFYHIYNRGVNKNNIYADKQDYQTFLYYIKKYLSPPPPHQINNNNLNKDLQLVCYCLMPNHYHLLIHQKTPNAITDFIRRLATNYSMYFNHKHKRVGSLYEGVYKAVPVQTDEQLIHLSRYIHLNPNSYHTYPYSSYNYYLSKNKPLWLHPEYVLKIFSEDINKAQESYRGFIKQYSEKAKVTPKKESIIDSIRIDS